jgi:hypothetical protein
MTITVYTFEDEHGAEQIWTTQNPVEAKAHAEYYAYKCYENEFEYSDQTVAWDFTTKAPS